MPEALVGDPAMERMNVVRADDQAPAVFVDDAVVTGHTARLVRRVLQDRSVGNVRTFALLTRAEPDVHQSPTRSPGNGHESPPEESGRASSSPPETAMKTWWSLWLPPTGSDRTCTICRGLERLRNVRGRTGSSIVKATITEWIECWEETDNLHRFPQQAAERAAAGSRRQETRKRPA